MIKRRTLDKCIGKWAGILINFGLSDEYLSKKNSGCPLCGGGKDRYRYTDWEGSGSYRCERCGHGFGIDLLMKYRCWDFKTATSEIDKMINNVQAVEIKQEQSESEKVAHIRKILKQCIQVQPGDPVSRYLHKRCGAEKVSNDIRYHPSLSHTEGGFHPAMISIVRAKNGSGLSIHRTYLTADGDKANVTQVKKFMSGKKLNGGAVRLFEAIDSVGIAEGIETAISASLKFNIPVWAASCASLLEQWEPPETIKNVVIFGDNDLNFVGQSAAYNLARRLKKQGLSVDVKIPELHGSDWNDN